MKINVKYFSAFLVLLTLEIIIGFFVHDAIIRPYVGDILVVILMYCFIKGIIQKPIRFLPIYLLIFASVVEIAQFFHVLNVFNLQDHKVTSIIVGASFDINDILCYISGTVILILWEKVIKYKL